MLVRRRANLVDTRLQKSDGVTPVVSNAVDDQVRVTGVRIISRTEPVGNFARADLQPR